MLASPLTLSHNNYLQSWEYLYHFLTAKHETLNDLTFHAQAKHPPGKINETER